MRQRCSNPNDPAYENYGGRGITVCERWESFASFIADIGQPPTRSYTIERIDNSCGYEPGNVRWATRTEQNRNTRRNHVLTIGGESMPLSAWSDRSGVPDTLIWDRLVMLGWSAKDAVFVPIGRRDKKHKPLPE
jgi:hypothetical protein